MPYTIYDAVGKIVYVGDSYELACMAMMAAPDGSALFVGATMLSEKVNGQVLSAEEGLMA